MHSLYDFILLNYSSVVKHSLDSLTKHSLLTLNLNLNYLNIFSIHQTIPSLKDIRLIVYKILTQEWNVSIKLMQIHIIVHYDYFNISE
jgi:hypothetical protein